MSSFKTLLGAFLSESEDNAKRETIATCLMKTGKYDPSVRGAAAQFKRDLIATGITDSPTSANFAWKNHKHLHPGKPKSNLDNSSVVGLNHNQVTRTNKIDDERYGTHKNEDVPSSYSNKNFWSTVE